MSSTLSTFRFDDRLTKIIEELKSETSATSKAEIVRRAISLLKVVQDGKNRGEKLVLISESDEGRKEREIILP